MFSPLCRNAQWQALICPELWKRGGCLGRPGTKQQRTFTFDLLLLPALTTCPMSTTVVTPYSNQRLASLLPDMHAEPFHVCGQPTTASSPFRGIAWLWNCTRKKIFIYCLHLVEKSEKTQQGEANEYKIEAEERDRIRNQMQQHYFFSLFFFLNQRNTDIPPTSAGHKLRNSKLMILHIKVKSLRQPPRECRWLSFTWVTPLT